MDGHLELLVDFLREIAAGHHDIDILDVHEPALCDRCVATDALRAIARAACSPRQQREIAIAAVQPVTGNPCRCNFPGPGESGIIVSIGCRARELLGQPASLQHAGRAFEAAGVISPR